MNQIPMYSETGEVLRDLGMQKAIDSAEDQTPNWQELAYAQLEKYVKSYAKNYCLKSFMAEDIRAWAHDQGLPRPPSSRAWGGIIHKARSRGLIKRIGTATVKNPTAHCANAALWASNV